MEVSWLDLLTLSTALVGAVLGVFNTVHGYLQTKVRLRVTPKALLHVDGGVISTTSANVPPEMNNVGIEVVNLSGFAVTVNEVGVLFRGETRRGVLVAPRLTDPHQKRTLPIRLQPRESFTCFAEPMQMARTLLKGNVYAAFAETDCGYREKVTSPAFKEICRRVHAAFGTREGL